MVRLAEGVRTLPKELQLKDALIGVMRSVANAWGQRSHHDVLAPMQSSDGNGRPQEPAMPGGIVSITPERIHSAKERLSRIHQAFQDDPDGLTIIEGWELGMTGPEIQRSSGVPEKRFRAAEKRVLRLLAKLENPYA
jgi:hypothetical protein